MGELVADMGTFILNAAGEIETQADAIIVLEDTIFYDIRVNKEDGNVVGKYIAKPGSAVKAGAKITPLNDAQFTFVSTLDGSIALILG